MCCSVLQCVAVCCSVLQCDLLVEYHYIICHIYRVIFIVHSIFCYIHSAFVYNTYITFMIFCVLHINLPDDMPTAPSSLSNTYGSASESRVEASAYAVEM